MVIPCIIFDVYFFSLIQYFDGVAVLCTEQRILVCVADCVICLPPFIESQLLPAVCNI